MCALRCNGTTLKIFFGKSIHPLGGIACPILIGNRLIYTTEPADLICVDSKTGKLLWQDSNAYEDVTAFTTTERAAGIKDDIF
ncbi:MAG: hypothetical protein HN457_06615 [Opitutales bacterium]|nr:hypothetical protein [Opitutales bacterium]MBT5813419.1 hypothetical protein [Opitutales bacterium]